MSIKRRYCDCQSTVRKYFELNKLGLLLFFKYKSDSILLIIFFLMFFANWVTEYWLLLLV